MNGDREGCRKLVNGDPLVVGRIKEEDAEPTPEACDRRR